MGRQFEVSHSGELAADTATVFGAITTGVGGWMFPTENVGAVGATGPDSPTVADWAPGERLTIRLDGPDGWFNQLVHRLSPRPGGRTWLDYTHTGVFPEAEYETQYEACRLHTAFYQHSLGEYVRHFAGRPITYLEPTAPGPFAETLHRLGVTDRMTVGDTVRLDIPGCPAEDAVIDYRTPHFLGLRSKTGLYRVFGRETWGMPTGVTLHLFTADADAAAAAAKTEQSWTTHLAT